MTIAGLAPKRLAAVQVDIDHLQPAAFNHLHDGHLRCRTRQPVRQWHGDVVGALGCGSQDGSLSFGEYGHCGYLLLVVFCKEDDDAGHAVVVAFLGGP